MEDSANENKEELKRVSIEDFIREESHRALIKMFGGIVEQEARERIISKGSPKEVIGGVLLESREEICLATRKCKKNIPVTVKANRLIAILDLALSGIEKISDKEIHTWLDSHSSAFEEE